MKNQSKYLFLALGLSIIFGNSAYGMGVMAKGLAAKFMQQSLINRISFGMSSLSLAMSSYSLFKSECTFKKQFELQKIMMETLEVMEAMNNPQEIQVVGICFNVPKKNELTITPDTDENEQAEKTQQQ